jgi:predicted HAD superfamily Cof-like phosphohydrolase
MQTQSQPARPTKTAIKAAALRTDVLRAEIAEVLHSNRSASVQQKMVRCIEEDLAVATAELERLQAARG